MYQHYAPVARRSLLLYRNIKMNANIAQNCGANQTWLPVVIKHTGTAASTSVNIKNGINFDIICINFLEIW